MSLFIFIIAVSLLTIPAYTPAWAQSSEAARVQSASAVLTEVMSTPEGGIPQSLLDNAYGVAVIPGALKAAFVFGGSYGNGIMVRKTATGGWSNPVFISLGGASFGFQAGVEATDVILVFQSLRSVDALTSGKITLGGDASVAIGPVGRTAKIGMDATLNAEIYSYSLSRGLFAGLAVDGAVLTIDSSANQAFYNQPGITASMIYNEKGVNAPRLASRFACTLASYTHTKMRKCG